MTAWIKSLDIPKDDKELAAMLRVKGHPVENLEAMELNHAVEHLAAALKLIHEPTSQEISVVRRIVGVGTAHAARHYATDLIFLQGANSRDPFGQEATIAMLTSLAGYGKSQISAAMFRLLKSRPPERRGPFLPELPIVPFVAIKVESRTTHPDVLNLIANALGIATSFSTARSADIALIRLRLFQCGCSFIIADELQFLTRGSSASTQIVKFLGFLNLLGVPVIYICNFSLGHRLKKRPQEDRDRLISDPMILIPEASKDPSSIQLLKEFIVVFDGRLEIDPEKDADEIHTLTFNLRRYTRRLFTFAYRGARERHCGAPDSLRVTMADIRLAYASLAYESDRKAVKECHGLLLGIKSSGNDMVCPFDLPASLMEQQRKQAEKLKSDEHAQSRLAAALTQDERASTELIAAASKTPINPAKSIEKVTRPKRPVATKASLLASFNK